MANNPLPDFFVLLYETHSALEEVDNFDLDSTKSNSVVEFGTLVEKQTEYCLKLVDYILRYQETLKYAFSVNRLVTPAE